MKKSGIKKILAILLSVVLGCGAIAGIVVAVKKTTGGAGILVVQAGNFNSGGWYGDMNSMEGIVMSEASQDVYVAETDTIAEVLVAEGDTVKEGDLLLRFDQTKTGLALERQQLAYDKLVLAVDVAKQNVETLNRMRPYYEPVYIDPVPEDPEEPEEPTTADIYGEQPAKDVLTSTKDAYNAADADGTPENPFRFLVKDGTKVSAAFFAGLGSQNYVLETRTGNMLSGDVTGTYYKAPSALADLGTDWTGTLNFSDHDKPALILDKKEGEEEPADPSEELEQVKKELEELKQTSEADKETIAKLEEEKKALEEKIAEMESQQGGGSSEADQARIAELEQQLADTQSTLAEKEAQLGEKDTEIEGLNARIAELEARIKELEENGDAPATGVLLPGSFTGIFGASVRRGPAGMLTAARAAARKLFEGEYDDLFSQSGLISPGTQYTSEELAQARKEAADTLRDLELDLKEAALHLESAKEADEAGEIHAKMNGVVKKLGDPANPIGDGTPFLSVAGSAGQYVQGGLSELLLDTVKPGDPVQVMSWENGMTYDGTVSEVMPYPDTTGMFSGYGETAAATYYPFTVYVENGEGLMPGYWVQLTVAGSGDAESMEMSDSGFYLYRAFILDEGGRKYVFKRGEDGLLHKTEIRTGALQGDGYKILSGVTEEDWIAFPYGKGVKEGAKTREGTPDELYSM